MAVANGYPSVTDPAAPAAPQPTPPDQTTPPAPAQPAVPAAQSGDPAALQAKLDLVLQDRAEQGQKNAKLAEQLADALKRLDELNTRVASGKTAKLEEQGKYQQLWEEAKATVQARDQRITDLETELATTKGDVTAERLKSSALAKITAKGAINPDQLYQLLQPNLREVAGNPVMMAGGIEQPLDAYLTNLRAPTSGWDHHFAPSGRSGMGSEPGAAPTVAPGMNNPWRSGNVTQQLIMVRDNPELAKALQAEAAKG